MSNRPACERGFTLIELLVALAVFSLAALTLLRLEGATIANAASLEDQAIAQIVARNVAVEAMTDPTPPALGVSTGEEENGGRQWRWTRTTAPSASEARVQQIDITVTDRDGRQAGALTVYRPAP